MASFSLSPVQVQGQIIADISLESQAEILLDLDSIILSKTLSDYSENCI